MGSICELLGWPRPNSRHKTHGALGLDRRNGGVAVLRDDISTVKEAAGHVLALAGVALDHLVRRLEARVSHLRDRILLVVGLVRREDRRVRREGEVDTREGNQVGLELVEIDIEGSVEPEGRGNGRDDLGDKPVEVGVRRRLDAKVAAADLVDAMWKSESEVSPSSVGNCEETEKTTTHASLSTMKEQSECSSVV